MYRLMYSKGSSVIRFVDGYKFFTHLWQCPLFTMPVRPTNEYPLNIKKCAYHSVFNPFQRCPFSGRIHVTPLHAYPYSSRINHVYSTFRRCHQINIYSALFHQANLSAMFNEKRNFSSDDSSCQCCDNVGDMLAPSQSITWYKIRHVRQQVYGNHI